MPTVGPLHEMKDVPEEGALLLLHFADGSKADGVRIGEVYLSRAVKVEPVAWQLMARMGMILRDDDPAASGNRECP